MKEQHDEFDVSARIRAREVRILVSTFAPSSLSRPAWISSTSSPRLGPLDGHSI